MSAVPCAFAPIPFAMVGIVEMAFVLGGPMTAPVFVASFVAFLPPGRGLQTFHRLAMGSGAPARTGALHSSM